MMRGASGDECGNLVLGQESKRPAEAGVLKKPRGSDFYCVQVISLYHHADSSPFCNLHYLFTLLFLTEQTRHGRKIISFCFVLFTFGRAKYLSPELYVG
jgi:hypothetical protein